MKVCKVKPDYNFCCSCVDDQERKIIPKKGCKECLADKPEHEILQIVTTIFGKVFALVIIDEKIEKIPIDRLYGVREIQPVVISMKEAGKYGY